MRQGATVLITGASTGLGLALSKLLLGGADRLILTARRASIPRFESHGIRESDRIWIRELDVADSASRRRVVGEIDSRLGGVDVLVNNAGLTYRSVLEHVTEADLRSQMAVNFEGPIELTRLVLPSMRAKGAGRIINVSSVSGMMAMPTMAVYSASKFALEGASEALWYEVRPWNIHVTLVEPGFIHSDSFRNTRLTDASSAAAADPSGPYYSHYRFMGTFIERMMQASFATPDRVARVIVRTMRRKRPPLRVLATPDAVLFFYLRRFLPRRLYHAILYRNLPRIGEWGPRPVLTERSRSGP